MHKQLRVLGGAAFLVCCLTADAFAAGKPGPTPTPTPSQRATVAMIGGDYTSPVTAMANLATWCGTPSATKPCLLKIMPGVYNIGSSYILLPQYVDLEGSGPGVTTIQGLDTVEFQNEGGKEWYHGIVRLNGGNVRNLTVEALGALYDDPYCIEVRESARIENVTAVSHEGGSPIYVWTSLLGNPAPPQLVGADVVIDNVTVLIPTPADYATGIESNRTTSLVIRDSNVEIGDCSAGCVSVVGISVYAANSRAAIHNSSVASPQYGILKSNPTTNNNIVAVFDTRIGAPAPLSGTGFKCYDALDANLDPLTCQ